MFRKITDVGYGFFSRASTSLPSTASVDNLCEEEEMPSTMECQNREDANRIAYMVHDSVANRRDLMSSREVSVDLSQPPTKAAEENRYPDAKSKRLLIAANRLNGCNFFQKACTWLYVLSYRRLHVMQCLVLLMLSSFSYLLQSQHSRQDTHDSSAAAFALDDTWCRVLGLPYWSDPIRW